MKSSFLTKRTLVLAFAVAAILSVYSCKSQPETAAEADAPAPAMEAVDTTGPEYTSRYICPMYCKGSGSDQPGTCPACGMEYVLNEDFHETHADSTSAQ
ncbi:MAG: hypothetical protein KBF37_08520 [Saprospiraceae bacterium]|nr:hypothetical protein [Saprospiraceae bacterium]MBP9210348.1 hypothetical protein [Saprospiraceae bacterium]